MLNGIRAICASIRSQVQQKSISKTQLWHQHQNLQREHRKLKTLTFSLLSEVIALKEQLYQREGVNSLVSFIEERERNEQRSHPAHRLEWPVLPHEEDFVSMGRALSLQSITEVGEVGDPELSDPHCSHSFTG